MKKTIALYPGTFDPITHGHTHLILRAANLFDKVIVAIAKSVHKSPYFDLKQREELVQQVLMPFKNVEVCCFEGLTVELAQQKGANILLRGMRMASDLSDEAQLSYMNQAMYPDMDTIFLIPSPEYAHISSSLVKEIASMGGDISPFVDDIVRDSWH